MTLPNSGIPLGESSGSNATQELHETIRAFNAATERQTHEMLRLTRVLTVLTAIMLIAVVVQIVVAVVDLRG